MLIFNDAPSLEMTALLHGIALTDLDAIVITALTAADAADRADAKESLLEFGIEVLD